MVDLHQPGLTVFVAGSGRSGTTWVADIVNWNNRFRFLFEPFHRRVTALYGWSEGLGYMHPESCSPDVLRYVRRIIEGRIRNHWVDAQNRKFWCRDRLIKDVNSCLMLGWLVRQFLQIKLIFILRDPLAVAESKMRLGWKPRLSRYLNQPALVEKYLDSKIDLLRRIDDVRLQHIGQWCIENYVALREMSEKNVCLVFYEELMKSRERNIRRMFDLAGLKIDNSAMESSRYPSFTRFAGSREFAERNVKHPRAVRELLELFDLHTLYEDGCPDPQAPCVIGFTA